ncbi:MAG: Fur-regulated basic protein FbpA [Sporolactobacillus sp.]
MAEKHPGKEQRKAFIIDQLLDRGIYKYRNHQLYELSLDELEATYQHIACAN